MYNLENGLEWTEDLKDAFKKGTTHASVVYNSQDYNEDNYLKEAELNDTRYVPNVGIIGQAVARMLTIKMVNDENSNLNFENADIQFKIGAEYEGNIYYINYGNFIVNEPPENDDTNGTVKFTAHDYMIKFNKPYEDRVTYPCSLKDLLLDICLQAGVILGTSTFPNENFIVENNQFEGKQLREVLQHIAKSAFSWARIGQDNQLYLDFEVSDNVTETITVDDYKMDAFKKANEFYGPVNKVTFADSDIQGQEESVQDDNSIMLNGEKEIIIYDNYFAYTTQKRQELIQAGTVLFGLTYMPIQELDMVGLVYLDSNDIIEIEDSSENTVLTRNFSHIIKYNGVVSDTIETIGESNNEQTYANVNNAAFQNSRTEIIVDRSKKQIQSVVEEVGVQNQKIAQVTQTVNELNSKISDIADITISQETNTGRLTFTDINQSEPIRIEIHPISRSITKTYPMNAYTGPDGIFPSSSTYMGGRLLRFTNTTTSEVFDYELPRDLLYYQGVYDEFILDYEGLSCIVNQRISRDDYNELSVITEQTITYPFPHINLTDGDYRVELVGYSSAYLFARLMAQNIYTTQFATKSELNSEISQTVDSINASVNQRLSNYSTTTEMNAAISISAREISSIVSEKVGKNEVISSINQTSESIKINANKITISANDILNVLAGNTINMTSKNIVITSTNFSVDANGNMTANSGRIGGWTIENGKMYAGDGGTIKTAVVQAPASNNNWVFAAGGSTHTTYGDCPFRVDKNGNLYATSANISGNVNSTNGTFQNCTITNSCTIPASTVQGILASANIPTLSANKLSGGTINSSTVSLKNATLGTTSSKIGGFNANTNNLKSSTSYGNIGIGLNLYGNMPAFYVEDATTDYWSVLTYNGLVTNGSVTSSRGVCQGSRAEIKKNIKRLENALNIIKNIDIYKYNLKEEENTDKKHIGFVIGEKFNYSKQLTTKQNDGVDLYSFVSVCCKAIQEQQEQIESLKNEIKILKEGK